MKVVLDTNVIVAAFAARGLCAEILEVCLENHSIVISEHIVSEVEKNLVKKIRLPKKIARSIADYLRDVPEIVKPEPVISVMASSVPTTRLSTTVVVALTTVLLKSAKLARAEKSDVVATVRP